MPDKLTEVAKKLGQTKRNSEAALRRYAAEHPRIERVRDVFDSVVPFEMEFDIKPNDSIMHMDLNFNKPPPMRDCKNGQFALPCKIFIATAGSNLFNVGSSYWPLSVSVFINGEQAASGTFSEYDPFNGLVYVIGLQDGDEVSICFLTNSWELICNDISDVLVDTTSNYAYIGPGNDPEFTNDNNFISPNGSINVDTSSPTSSRSKTRSTTIADYFLSLTDHKVDVEWTSHLGSLDNLPPGDSHLTVGMAGFIDEDAPRIVDWENVEISLRLENATGTHIGQYLDFFSSAPEESSLAVEIGTAFLKIEMTALHDDRSGFFPFLGPPQPPRSTIKFINGGQYDWQGNSVPDMNVESPTFTFGMNDPVHATLRINRNQNHISIDSTVGYYSWSLPRFRGGFAQQGININWGAACWLTDTAPMYGRVTVLSIKPCAFEPGR